MQRDELLATLRARFEAHPQRHADLEWAAVQARLQTNGATLWSLDRMERSGSEKSSAAEMAAAMGAALLTAAQYRRLQELGQFDTATSSWVRTPARIRKLGGALFCDRRYDTVFVYHNGAESYYAARGFRCSLLV
jgi:hypothetical protein